MTIAKQRTNIALHRKKRGFMRKLNKQTIELHSKGWTVQEFMLHIGRNDMGWWLRQCKRNSTELDLMIKGLDKKDM